MRRTAYRILLIFSSLTILIIIIHSCRRDEVPNLTTTEITNITEKSALSGGTITDLGTGTILARGICWSTDNSPTVDDNITTDGEGEGTFESNLTELNSATTYYVRAYATNHAGTGYGNEIMFNTIFIGKYILEIDKNFNIYKVSYSDIDFNRKFNIEYFYSTGSIRKTVKRYGEFGGTNVTIFYLNNFGLADSSSSHGSSSYFLYDSNNYLEMSITKIPNFSYYPPDTTFYDYDNGNLIKSTGTYPTSYTYTYNSKKSFIDIRSFNGGFLGILNQNLFESLCEYGLPEYPEYSMCIRYEYILYSNGLVKERRRIYNIDSNDNFIVDEFEYIIR